MFEAIADGRADVAQKLAKFLPKTDKTMANAGAFLRRLAFEGNVVGMQRLIEATGVGLDDKDKDNDTPLFYAVEGRKMDAVMYLINHGADIKAVGCGDETLLHCAVKWDLGLVKYLVEHGLDVNAKNKAGITPLHHAIRHLAVVAYLLEHGADVNVSATDGMPLAVCVSLIGTEETLKALGEKGMDFKGKTKDGFTAMHAAAAANPSVVPYLRSLGLPEPSEEDMKKAKKRFITQLGDHESINCGFHAWPHQHILFGL
jgi:ankyrin repeat protein